MVHMDLFLDLSIAFFIADQPASIEAREFGGLETGGICSCHGQPSHGNGHLNILPDNKEAIGLMTQLSAG